MTAPVEATAKDLIEQNLDPLIPFLRQMVRITVSDAEGKAMTITVGQLKALDSASAVRGWGIGVDLRLDGASVTAEFDEKIKIEEISQDPVEQ